MFFLNPIYPIFKAGDKICCGIPGKKNYVEFQYNQNVVTNIEKLIKSGATHYEVLSVKIYRTLRKHNLLVKSINAKSKSLRKDLFINYLNLNKYTLKELNQPILIFGAGAGGSTLCYLLAQFGFNNIIIADSDIVEGSEIEKTLIYRKTDIGKKKIIALKETINNNFDISIQIIDKLLFEKTELSEVITKINPKIVIKACDPNLEFRLNLSEVCFQTNTPFIYMAYSYENLIIGPLFIPGKTKSDSVFNDYQKKHYGEHFDFKLVKKLFSEHTTHPSISFNINMLSSIIFKEILFFLKKDYKYVNTIGKQLVFCPLDMQGYVIDLDKI